MANFDNFESIPVGSLSSLPEKSREKYIGLLFKLPETVFDIMNSPRTGSYMRGLVKSYQLSVERSDTIAFSVLRVTVGEKTLAQLASLLSTELKLPNDKAQRMAQEIEKDLFGPVMKELEEYWQRQKNVPGPDDKKNITTDKASEGGARNILDLKQKKKPPVPPPMPGLSNQ